VLARSSALGASLAMSCPGRSCSARAAASVAMRPASSASCPPCQTWRSTVPAT